MRLSILYFANRDAATAPEQYDLLVRAAQTADRAGLEAVWLPERHFHPFGGAFPSASLAAAVVAATTGRIRVRAGSVVLPLNDPLRVAEEWAFVDALSGGRVDLAVATGWNANDFVLAPAAFPDRRQRTYEGLREVQRLWAGGAVTRRNGAGEEVEVRTFPRPVQPALQAWLTCSQSLEGFRDAGRLGLNVLTALLFQGTGDLASKVQAYRSARAEAGLDPATGIVTLMLHTYVGGSDEDVRSVVRPAFIEYLRSSVSLWGQQAPALRVERAGGEDRMLQWAFERYHRSAAMFGPPAACRDRLGELEAAGVDEVAALIDFGLPADLVVRGVERLGGLHDRRPAPSGV